MRSEELGEPDPTRDLLTPHPQRFGPDDPSYAATLAAHEEALRAGRQLYTDPVTGLSVMTALTLAVRGQCCDTGCRHCPYLRS